MFKVLKEKGMNRAGSHTYTLTRKASSDIDGCETMLKLTSDIYNASVKALEDYQALKVILKPQRAINTHSSCSARQFSTNEDPCPVGFVIVSSVLWFRDDPDFTLNASEVPPALALPPCEEDSTLFETKAENSRHQDLESSHPVRYV